MDEFDEQVDDEFDEQVESEEPTTFFANYGEWVEEFAVRHYHRQGMLWDREWYNYTDVCSVLRALWMAWEHLSSDKGGPLGMSVFYRDHFFPHMDRLTSETGPFANANDPIRRGPLADLDPGDIDPAWFTPRSPE